MRWVLICNQCSLKNTSETGSELLEWARIDVVNVFLWSILFWFDFHHQLYIAGTNTLLFSVLQNCFAILEDEMYSFPSYFKPTRFWSSINPALEMEDFGWWAKSRKFSIWGPFYSHLAAPVGLQMWIFKFLGPEYGQGLPLTSVWATHWDSPAFSRAIFDGLHSRKHLKLHFALGLKSGIGS